jgi:hypothetical protein
MQRNVQVEQRNCEYLQQTRELRFKKLPDFKVINLF